MSSQTKRRVAGGLGLPGIMALLIATAAAVFALSLMTKARTVFPTFHGLSEAHPERPFDNSTYGHLIDWLFNFATYGITLLFVLMCFFLFWSSFNHREGLYKAVYEHGTGRKHLIRTAMVAGAIFFGLDGTLLYNALVDLNTEFYKYPSADEHPLTIEVMAQQWAWNFRYPGKDGKFNTEDDIVTINELHVPVGQPVLLRMQSKDVIHSFYLPNFRNKQDVFPGTTTRLWFEAKQPGEFDIGCAQHCGAFHFKMRALLKVETPEDYAKWEKTETDISVARYDKDDVEAHWGWDWEY